MKAPFFIAEVSANHCGDKEKALQLIKAAKDAGADAVKFQCWAQDKMCLDPNYEISDGQWAGRNLKQLYAEAWTPWEWFPDLFAYADLVEIVCFASVFDEESLTFLESLDCPMYKIASFELTDTPLIKQVAATLKPIIISTGMGTFDEIVTAQAVAYATGNRDIAILKCTSAYPADASQANLATLEELKMAIGGDDVAIGLSDHTQGYAVAVAATILGATVIEKHLMLPGDETLDASFSMTPDQFKEMVTACIQAMSSIGERVYGPQKGESIALRRSLYAALDIPIGEQVTEAHIRTARPAQGLSPRYKSRVLGSRFRRDVKAGEPITEEML